MERLTDCAQGYCEMYCKKYLLCFGDPGDCIFKDEIKMYDALKSIEGIVPFDRLLELADADKAGRLVVLPEPLKRAIVREGGRCFSDFTMDDINNLLEAWDAGRLVVLPCKVGDTVYWLHNCFITECRVHRIQMNRTGLFICLKSKVSHGAFRVDICLGKTVFLTREEAETALAGKGGDV